jgi:hypothetical protein
MSSPQESCAETSVRVACRRSTEAVTGAPRGWCCLNTAMSCDARQPEPSRIATHSLAGLFGRNGIFIVVVADLGCGVAADTLCTPAEICDGPSAGAFLISAKKNPTMRGGAADGGEFGAPLGLTRAHSILSYCHAWRTQHSGILLSSSALVRCSRPIFGTTTLWSHLGGACEKTRQANHALRRTLLCWLQS